VTSSVKGGRMLALHEQRRHQQQHTVNEARKLYSQRQPHATFRNERRIFRQSKAVTTAWGRQTSRVIV
jgi:hypothetical protein